MDWSNRFTLKGFLPCIHPFKWMGRVEKKESYELVFKWFATWEKEHELCLRKFANPTHKKEGAMTIRIPDNGSRGRARLGCACPQH